jgi:hypothetical protein
MNVRLIARRTGRVLLTLLGVPPLLAALSLLAMGVGYTWYAVTNAPFDPMALVFLGGGTLSFLPAMVPILAWPAFVRRFTSLADEPPRTRAARVLDATRAFLPAAWLALPVGSTLVELLVTAPAVVLAGWRSDGQVVMWWLIVGVPYVIMLTAWAVSLLTGRTPGGRRSPGRVLFPEPMTPGAQGRRSRAIVVAATAYLVLSALPPLYSLADLALFRLSA